MTTGRAFLPSPCLGQGVGCVRPSSNERSPRLMIRMMRVMGEACSLPSSKRPSFVCSRSRTGRGPAAKVGSDSASNRANRTAAMGFLHMTPPIPGKGQVDLEERSSWRRSDDSAGFPTERGYSPPYLCKMPHMLWQRWSYDA